MTTFTHDQVETALATFEAFLDTNCQGAATFSENNGIAALRGVAIALAPTFETIWQSKPLGYRDAVTWDWEFIPTLVRAIDWDNPEKTPIAAFEQAVNSL